MRIITLNGRNDLDAGHRVDAVSTDAPPVVAGDSLEEVEAALRSEIANLQVSRQNVTASDSHVSGTEMSAEMLAYTESHIQSQAGPDTILDLLQ
jgi:hypothetical protein